MDRCSGQWDRSLILVSGTKYAYFYLAIFR